jgi:hypothetical protein
MAAKIIWTAETGNRKTGNIPTAYIGTTKEEAWASCEGCPLRAKDCYAWHGSVRIGHTVALNGYKKNPAKYTFGNALRMRSKSARMVRVSAIGDPSEANHRTLHSNAKEVRKLGLAYIGYTHFHMRPKNEGLKSLFMASCGSIQEADDAVKRGWRATAVVPWDYAPKRSITPAGNTALVCPAQTTANAINCNDCLLCDASRKTNFDIILFRDHGPKARADARRAKKLPVVV